jgi:hypothetical protein
LYFRDVRLSRSEIGNDAAPSPPLAPVHPVMYYTQSSFKRNGNKRNEHLGVRKKRSTQFLGVRNAVLTGGEKSNGPQGPRPQAIKILNMRWINGSQQRSKGTGTGSGGHGRCIISLRAQWNIFVVSY